MSEPKGAPAKGRDAEAPNTTERPRPALPLWLWMLLLTAAIAALLIVVGRQSFAA